MNRYRRPPINEHNGGLLSNLCFVTFHANLSPISSFSSLIDREKILYEKKKREKREKKDFFENRRSMAGRKMARADGRRSVSQVGRMI